MKILLVSDDLFPGGAAKHVIDLANELFRRGYEVHVSTGEGEYRSKLLPQIPYFPLPLMKAVKRKKHLTGLFRSYLELRKVILKNSYNIVHSHKRFVQMLVQMAVPRRFVHVTTYHNTFQDKKSLSVYGDYTICCSNAVREMVISSRGNESNSSTIHCGITPFAVYDKQQNKKTYRQIGVSEDKKIVSSVGLFAPFKDRTTLINAIHLFKDKYGKDDVVFTIQGYGEEEKQLRELVNSLSLNDTVVFLPHFFNTEALFNISEFVVLSSKDSEGFPLVLLEAASVGKIHIGTSVGGIPEFIEHGNTGMLVRPKRPDELSEMIQRLILNQTEYQRMGKNAKLKFQKYFTLDKMVDSIIHVYEQLMP